MLPLPALARKRKEKNSPIFLKEKITPFFEKMFISTLSNINFCFCYDPENYPSGRSSKDYTSLQTVMPLFNNAVEMERFSPLQYGVLLLIEILSIKEIGKVAGHVLGSEEGLPPKHTLYRLKVSPNSCPSDNILNQFPLSNPIYWRMCFI